MEPQSCFSVYASLGALGFLIRAEAQYWILKIESGKMEPNSIGSHTFYTVRLSSKDSENWSYLRMGSVHCLGPSFHLKIDLKWA